jgi:hypothetical protein
VDRFFLNRFLGGSIQARGSNLNVAFILVWQLGSVDRSPAEAYNFDRFQVRSRFGSSLELVRDGKFMIKNAVAAVMRGCTFVFLRKRIALAPDLHRKLSEEIHCSCEVGQLKEILWKL